MLTGVTWFFFCIRLTYSCQWSQITCTMTAKVWLITGTSSGFGRRLVAIVLRRGDRVIASARSLEKIKDFPNSPNLYRLELDVTAGTEIVKHRIEAAVQDSGWGTIDVLVNNAGIGLPALLEEGGVQKMREQFETNVFGTLDVTNAVLPYMRQSKSGVVVIIGSRSAWRPEIRGLGFYASSKAAIQTFGETLAVELEPLNIRVLIVEPGAFRTEGIYVHPFDDSNPIPEYDEERIDTVASWGLVAGKQPGDPEKAMNAVVDIVRGEGCAVGREWPLYLVLGKDADKDVRHKCARMMRHLDEWGDVVSGVDFDDTVS
ncbi:hypothetical protein F5I97DRAFT_39389 [Phlebopus sp. FC_14]|nr:hypothetical protein F5I97DRAFT_39389 [Phlebopus sp. FC_14]